MKKNIIDIVPNIGLGDIKFEMSSDEITKLLGAPTEVESLEDDGVEAWHYDELELSLVFEKDSEDTLVNIAISSPEYEFHNTKLIGLSKEDLLSELDKMGITGFLLEEMVLEDDNQVVLISNETGLSFFIDDDVLSEIMLAQVEE